MRDQWKLEMTLDKFKYLWRKNARSIEIGMNKQCAMNGIRLTEQCARNGN